VVFVEVVVFPSPVVAVPLDEVSFLLEVPLLVTLPSLPVPFPPYVVVLD